MDPAPFSDHVTLVLLVLPTNAVNWTLCDCHGVAVVGRTSTSPAATIWMALMRAFQLSEVKTMVIWPLVTLTGNVASYGLFWPTSVYGLKWLRTLVPLMETSDTSLLADQMESSN